MARCTAKTGAGDSLHCCRLPHEDDTHHWHWQAFLHGISQPHRYAHRTSGQLLVCTEGDALDGDNP